MAKKPDITTIASGYYSRQALNNNFENLQDGFDNTLSLDGSTPNAMGADLDMNSNDILNAGEINTSFLRLGGVPVTSSSLSIESSVAATNVFTGDGSTTVYTLTYEPFVKDNTQVYIDGVYQNKVGYNTSGTTLTFTEAPPLNSQIEVMIATTLTDVGTAAAAAVTYKQGAVGTVNTTVQAKLQETVSVKDFGAVGNGAADDTSAIQAALDNEAGNNLVYLPAGTYMVSATIYIPSNTYFFGDGKNSVIKMIGTEGRDTTVVMTGFRDNKRENIVIENMTIDFNRDRWSVSGGTRIADAFYDGGANGYNEEQNNNQIALSICYSENVLVKNVRAIDGYKHCIDVSAPNYRKGTDGATYDSQPSKNVTLQNCYATGAGDDNITTHHSTDINITGCWSEYPSGRRVPSNSNCYEIDDGSRNVLMTDNVAVGGIYGLQIKGHSYAPAPYNITVDGFRTTNAAQGVELRHSGWYANKTSFDGTGSQTVFTLPAGFDVNAVVYVDDVLQVVTTDYTISGTTLTFVTAPPSGTDNVDVYKSDDGELPEIVDEDGELIEYTGTSPTARNVQLSNILVIAPRQVTQFNGTTYSAKYGMRIRSYENVQITNISFNDSTLDLADDYEDSTTLSGDAVFRVYSGAKNVTIKNASIYGFEDAERGFYTSGSLAGPFIVDGFTSSGGPQYPIRCSPSEGTYEGSISNYMIDGEQVNGAGLYVTCPLVQAGAGFVSSGYEAEVRGVGGTDAQPAPVTFNRRARSFGGGATTPVAVQQFNWQEDNQNLGVGEGLKLSWGLRLNADTVNSEFGYVGFEKASSTDGNRLQNFVVGQSADGGVTAPTKVFEIAADGTTRPSSNGTQSLGDASHKWSEVFASNGSINTSDERQKQDIADIDDAETRVAVALKGKLKKFKFRDAVAAKGDNARVHIGVMAQEVKAAFEAEGLDAHDYSMFCYDQWTTGSEEAGDLETHDSYGVRYTELLTFIISAL